MTSCNCAFSWRVTVLAMLLAFSPVGLQGGDSNTLRLAVGPFFAPVGSDSLRQASQVLPELLVADLSHMSRFQLVEREKIQAVWSELNLSASGLVERDTVAKLGRVLACDWLVSGSFVQAGGRTHVWTKVIDVRSGVVLDLNAAPYEPGGFTNTIAGIAAFLAKAGSHPKGRQFIAMGPFVDMNPLLGAKREDWSRRISALIEKHFLEAGIGVVEIAAVGPIFEERRLETAGLTGHPESRVKLQAAFWLVDGGCEWVEGSPGKLGVGLRVQRVGGPEQRFRLTESAGEEIEKAVIATITRALADPNLVAQPAPNAEADLLTARGMELATRRSPFQPKTFTTATAQTQSDSYKQIQEQKKRFLENRSAAIATYERTVLRDPKNLEAKTMLGYALLGDLQPARREHGKEMLREVVASKDSKYAALAQKHLANAEIGAFLNP
jgi:TolB-like protein